MSTYKDYRDLERNVVVAVAVTWGFLLKDGNVPKYPWEAWLIPCIFAFLGVVRALGIMKEFKSLHIYIQKIENAFNDLTEPEGWEHYSYKEKGIGRSATAFWFILNATTAIVCIYKLIRP
jgi:hypothetical protein